MKNFCLQLNYPPQGVYFPGMPVTGKVICEIEEPKNYKKIKIEMEGKGSVWWQETRYVNQNTTETITYSASEEYMSEIEYLWSKVDEPLPAGLHQFDFSFTLPSGGIPSSFQGTDGRIEYTLKATVVKGSLFKTDSITKTELTVNNEIRIDNPNLLQPALIEDEKTVCCLWCASGPVVMTAKIPRSGYCIGQDTIPIEVAVENGSSRTVRIHISIGKTVTYTACGHNKYDKSVISRISSNVLAAHSTSVFKPDDVQVPQIMTTSVNSEIISVQYYLKVVGVISYALFDLKAEFPIVLGNVPLLATDTYSNTAL